MVELPRDERIRWILSRSARLSGGGAEPVGGLVLPTAAFFPDHFDGSPRAVGLLLSRIVRLAGLGDLSIEAQVAPASEDQGGGGGGCSGGSCGVGAAAVAKFQRVVAKGDGYVVGIAPQEVGNPTVMTTAMVRAVSHIFLLEAALHDVFEVGEAELAIDLAGVALGFGVLLCNGAYLYSKGCGGVSVASATVMPVDELAHALAVHCKLHGFPSRQARAHLETTPQAHFDHSAAWAGSNASVVALVGSDRDAIEAGSYSLSEARSWFSRLFGIGQNRGPSAPTDDELASMASKAASDKTARGTSGSDAQNDKRLAAIRALVDESLDG